MQKFINLIFITIIYYLSVTNITQAASTTDVEIEQNLAYTTAKIEILPLLKLRDISLAKDNSLIFLHTPKTGGTTVGYAINAFKNITNRRFSVPRVEGQSPIFIVPGWIGGYENYIAECTTTDKCLQYKFLSGHFPFAGAEMQNPKYHYITLIRTPLTREISSLNFHYQRGYFKNRDEFKKLLLDVALDNPQTRMLAGKEYMSGALDEKVLQLAKNNLAKNFLVAGITEDTTTFIQVILSLLNLEPIAIGKAQVTNYKVYDIIPNDIVDALKEKHKYDLALYEYTKEKWLKWKKDHIFEKIAIKAEQNIISILPDFANSREAVIMNKEQIAEYNAKTQDNLVKVYQKHRTK